MTDDSGDSFSTATALDQGWCAPRPELIESDRDVRIADFAAHATHLEIVERLGGHAQPVARAVLRLARQGLPLAHFERAVSALFGLSSELSATMSVELGEFVFGETSVSDFHRAAVVPMLLELVRRHGQQAELGRWVQNHLASRVVGTALVDAVSPAEMPGLFELLANLDDPRLAPVRDAARESLLDA